MRKLINIFHSLAAYGTFISMVGMIAAVAIQIVGRFLLPSAPNWTEEAARIFFVYLVGFGAAIGIRDNAFVRLELLRSYLSDKNHKILQLVIFSTVFLFSLGMLYYSFAFVLLGLNERSPAVEISMSIVFSSILILMLSIALLSLEQVFQIFQSKNTTT